MKRLLFAAILLTAPLVTAHGQSTWQERYGTFAVPRSFVFFGCDGALSCHTLSIDLYAVAEPHPAYGVQSLRYRYEVTKPSQSSSYVSWFGRNLPYNYDASGGTYCTWGLTACDRSGMEQVGDSPLSPPVVLGTPTVDIRYGETPARPGFPYEYYNEQLPYTRLSLALVVVPEPSTYALMAAGLAALALVARRRRTS